MSRDDLYAALQKYNVFTRRYFYPLINDFPCHRHVALTAPLTKARRIAGQILTLPIYDLLALEDVERICRMIKELHLTRAADSVQQAHPVDQTVAGIQPRVHQHLPD